MKALPGAVVGALKRNDWLSRKQNRNTGFHKPAFYAYQQTLGQLFSMSYEGNSRVI